MIGEDYLHLRAQLGAAIFSLSSLAHDLHAEPEVFDTLHDLGDGLREPRLLVAVGDASAGKSALLNALFGRILCAANEEAQSEMRLFTFGAEASDDRHSGFIESQRPHAFLRDFQALDVPVSETQKPDEWETAAPFLARADAIFIVLSVTSPWAPATWDAAQFLAQNWAKKMIFVLQQSDQRSEVEVIAVVQHIEQKVREKIGVNRPVFAVSEKAGSPKLEGFLNELFARGEVSVGRLRSVGETAEKTLAATGRKAREAMVALKNESGRLSALEQKLADRQEQSLRGVGGALWTLAQTCETAQKRGEEWLQKRLSLFSTFTLFFKGTQWQDGIRDEVEVRLREALEKQIGNSIDLLQSDLKNVWQELNELLSKTAGHEALTAPDFGQQRVNLVQCIEAGLEPQLSSQQLDLELPRLFKQMETWLRVPFGIAISCGLASIPARLAGISIAPILAAIAGAAALLGVAMTTAKRNRLLAVYRETMITKREAMLAPIEDHMRHSIEVFYKSLPATFELLRDFCLTQQQIYEPLLARAQQLDGMFANVAREMGVKREK